MLFSNYRYVDIAIGGVNKRNNVVDITKFKIPIGQTDCYRTYFRFDESYLKHWQDNKTVGNYRGRCFADFMPIDIDDNDLEMATKKLKEAIEILRLDYSLEIEHLYFSGMKGYHLIIPIKVFGNILPNDEMPDIFKKIGEDIFQGIIDSSIYDKNRLLRLTNTKHSKSGLYKIPVTYNEINKGVEYIRNLAKETRDMNFYLLTDCVICEQLAELYRKHQENKGQKTYKLPIKNAEKGDRNTMTARYTGLLKSKGLDKNFAIQILTGWNLQNEPPLENNELEGVINSIYDRYESKEDELERDIFPIWSIKDEYLEFTKKREKVNLGIPELDNKIRGVRPGQVLTLLGFTGNLKSATLQAFMEHYEYYSKEAVLMFQMEMSRLDLFERALQRMYNITGGKVEQTFIKDEKEAENMALGLRQMHPNFYIVDLPALNFVTMTKYVKVLEEKIIRKKVGLVGIDFLQLMAGEGYTQIQKMDFVAKGMKEFAKRADVPVISISQVTSIESNEDNIKLMDVRDSKTIAQMSDYVIGIWQEDGKQVLALLKNRKGGLGQVRREVDTKNLVFGEAKKATDLF